MASRTKLPSAVTVVNTDGQSRVKPSEVLRPAAHATSSKPAISRRIQDMRQLHGQMGPSPFVAVRKVVLTNCNYIKIARHLAAASSRKGAADASGRLKPRPPAATPRPFP